MPSPFSGSLKSAVHHSLSLFQSFLLLIRALFCSITIGLAVLGFIADVVAGSDIIQVVLYYSLLSTY